MTEKREEVVGEEEEGESSGRSTEAQMWKSWDQKGLEKGRDLDELN